MITQGDNMMRNLPPVATHFLSCVISKDPNYEYIKVNVLREKKQPHTTVSILY